MESTVLKGRRNFVVLGNTTDESKYAYKIKKALSDNGYAVTAVPEEKDSLDEVDFDIDLLDFCINPKRGLDLIRNTDKMIAFAVLQPGAGSEEIEKALEEKRIPFVNGCVLRELEKEGRYSFEDSANR